MNHEALWMGCTRSIKDLRLAFYGRIPSHSTLRAFTARYCTIES